MHSKSPLYSLNKAQMCCLKLSILQMKEVYASWDFLGVTLSLRIHEQWSWALHDCLFTMFILPLFGNFGQNQLHKTIVLVKLYYRHSFVYLSCTWVMGIFKQVPQMFLSLCKVACSKFLLRFLRLTKEKSM